MLLIMIQDLYFPPKKHDLGWYLKRSRSVGCIRELKAVEDGTSILERKDTWKAKSFSGSLVFMREGISQKPSCHRKKQFSFAINAYSKCIIYTVLYFRFDFNPIHCLLQVYHKFIAVQGAKNFWLDLQHNGYYACGVMYVPWFWLFCIGKNCRILGLG